MISKSIFQIWLGTIPDKIRAMCDGVREMNRDMEYRLYGNEILERYGNDPYVRKMQSVDEKPAFIVDRLRAILLRDEGGWYVDSDCVAVHPLSSITTYEQTDFVTAFRNPRRPQVALFRGISLVDNTVFGTAKNGRIINKICSLYRPEAWKQTGNSMGADGMISHSDHTTIWLNYRYFYADVPTAETVVLHDAHNLKSWCDMRPTLAAV